MKIEVAIGNSDLAHRNRYYVVIERKRIRGPIEELNKVGDEIREKAGLDLEVERMLYIVNKKGLQKRQGLWDHFEKQGYKIKVLKRQAAMRYTFDTTKRG